MAQALNYSPLELLTRKVLPLTFVSFWGVFGHMNLFMGAYSKDVAAPAWTSLLTDRGYPPPSWLYPLLALVTLIALAGLLKAGVPAFRRSGVPAAGTNSAQSPQQGQQPQHIQQPTPNTQYLTGLLLLTWFLVVAAFLRFNTEFFQAQGRYLFPAMAPIAVGFAAGWLAWWPARRQPLALGLLLAGLLALALYALFGTLLPAF
jgi:hypothetical protein